MPAPCAAVVIAFRSPPAPPTSSNGPTSHPGGRALFWQPRHPRTSATASAGRDLRARDRRAAPASLRRRARLKYGGSLLTMRGDLIIDGTLFCAPLATSIPA